MTNPTQPGQVPEALPHAPSTTQEPDAAITARMAADRIKAQASPSVSPSPSVAPSVVTEEQRTAAVIRAARSVIARSQALYLQGLALTADDHTLGDLASALRGIDAKV